MTVRDVSAMTMTVRDASVTTMTVRDVSVTTITARDASAMIIAEAQIIVPRATRAQSVRRLDAVSLAEGDNARTISRASHSTTGAVSRPQMASTT